VDDGVIESARSEFPTFSTNTEVIVELFDATESVVADVTSAEFTIVEPATGAGGAGPALIFTTNMNAVVVVPLVSAEPSVQTIWPVLPTVGEVHVQPAGAAIEVKVVLGGVCW
jgi:hypothetical protein